MTAAKLNVLFASKGAAQAKSDLEEVGRAVVLDHSEVEQVRRELKKAGYGPRVFTHGCPRQDVIDLSRATADGLGDTGKGGD